MGPARGWGKTKVRPRRRQNGVGGSSDSQNDAIKATISKWILGPFKLSPPSGHDVAPMDVVTSRCTVGLYHHQMTQRDIRINLFNLITWSFIGLARKGEMVIRFFLIHSAAYGQYWVTYRPDSSYNESPTPSLRVEDHRVVRLQCSVVK